MFTEFFSKSTFSKKQISGIPAECQTVWIQIRPDILSGLICAQTICEGNQQTVLVGRVNFSNLVSPDVGRQIKKTVVFFFFLSYFEIIHIPLKEYNL